MKFLPLSDLHLELLPETFAYLPPEHEDDKNTIVLLAGDIHVGTNAVEWIEYIAGRYRAVCYILGNHEFYHHNFEDLSGEVEDLIGDMCPDNVYFLNNGSEIIEDTRVIGTTLWSDFNGFDPASMAVAEYQMNDFRMIRNKYGLLKPMDIVDEFEENIEYLHSELSKNHHGRTVVMTHHLPSFEFISEEFQHLRDLNGAFASDLSDIYSKYDIDLWVFGHSHQALVRRMHNSLFVTNARGYPDEVTLGFNDSMRIELLADEYTNKGDGGIIV